MSFFKFSHFYPGRLRMTVTALIFSLFMSACGDSRNSLERVRILSILVNCRAFATDNNGKYPEKLEDLYPKYIDLAENFYSPPRSEVEIEAQPYYYRPGLSVGAKIDEPLVVSPHVVKGKVNIGYLGGFIRNLEYTEAQKILAEPGWVKKAPPLSKVSVSETPK